MNQNIRCIINNQDVQTTLSPGLVALDFIRQYQNLPGTKEGCREGECGACTILLGELQDGNRVSYKAVASCLLPLGELDGKHVVTVEGINPDAKQSTAALTPVQQALTDQGASQCGFCTPGFVVALTGFFFVSKTLSYQDAIDAMDGNICRCTGYVPIQRAAKSLSETFGPKLKAENNRVGQLVEWGIVPPWFMGIPERLKKQSNREAGAQGSQGSPVVLVAGGTDLYVQQPAELEDAAIEFLSMRKDLKGIALEDGNIVIGAGVTVEDIKQSQVIAEHFPRMNEYLNLVSSTIMRNRATLAGNIVNASPIGDLSIILLALDARLSMTGGKKNGDRTLPLNEFFKGYKQYDLRPGEIIDAVVLPVPPAGRLFHFEKVSRRKYLDIASCNTAIAVQTVNGIIDYVCLSAGGVAPVPMILKETNAWLTGKTIDTGTIRGAAEVMVKEIAPISDVRGSAKYKTLLLRNLLFAHFITLFPGSGIEEVIS